MNKYKVTIECDDEEAGSHKLAFVILADNEHTALLYGEVQAIAMNAVVYTYDDAGFEMHPLWAVAVEEIVKPAIP